MADPLSIESWRNATQKFGRHFGWGFALVFGLPLVIGFGWSQYSGMRQGHANSAEQNKVIARVNGDPITLGQYQRAISAAQQRQPSSPGTQAVQLQGQVLKQLAGSVVVQQEAQKRGAKASEAEIDRTMAQVRERLVGPKASDNEWASALMQIQGMSPSEFREEVAKELAFPALTTMYKSEEKVTEKDAKDQYAQAKLTFVLIPTKSDSPFAAQMEKKTKPLPDADARKKAEDLLSKAQTGADLKAIAKANSSDFSSTKGGDLDWQDEFKDSMRGKEFDEAVRKTEKGKFTGVIKITGFQPGYGFARVEDRRPNLPKDFDAHKEIEKLREERGQKKLGEFLEKQIKAAKIEILDSDMKATYDLAKLQEMQQRKMMAQFNPEQAKDAPSQPELDKLQTEVNAELEAAQKHKPDDSNLALVVAQNLQTELLKNPAQKDQYRDRLITLYETTLKSAEIRQVRFDLAKLYEEKKENEKAAELYTKIGRLLNVSPPVSSMEMSQHQQARRDLMAAFNRLNKPEEAQKQQKLMDDLQVQIEAERKKELEKQKATGRAPGMPGGMPGGISNSITVPGGGKATIEKVTPGGGAKMPDSKAPDSKTPTPKTP